MRSLRISFSAPFCFVRASVWAEMRKAVSYMVDISLNTDAIVEESQCECGVGQGPAAHCKHSIAVLYGLAMCLLSSPAPKLVNFNAFSVFNNIVLHINNSDRPCVAEGNTAGAV